MSNNTSEVEANSLTAVLNNVGNAINPPQEEFEKELPVLEVIGNLLLFLLVFGMSATVEFDNLKTQLRNVKGIATGCILQFVVLPFLGFVTVKMLKLDDTMGITLLVVTSSPGGSYSNWWCSMFNADLALSVTMTTISTCLSMFFLPLNLILYANRSYDAAVVKSLNWTALFIALGVVMSAILLGLACSYKIRSSSFKKMSNMLGNAAGIALILFSVFAVSSDTESDLMGRGLDFYLGVALPCLLGLVISNIITIMAKLKKPERVTVSVECCYQNTGIATSVAITMFTGPALAEALGVPLYYGLVEMVVLGTYCIVAWKMGWTKAPSDENLCTIISKSYEIDEREVVTSDVDKEEDHLEESTAFMDPEGEDVFVEEEAVSEALKPRKPLSSQV